jgi:hypothetical protein
VVVTDEAVFFSGGLPLCSPTMDLMRHGVAPSSSLGLQEAIVFFLHLPQFQWCTRWRHGPDLRPLCPDLLLLLRLFFFSVLRLPFRPPITPR